MKKNSEAIRKWLKGYRLCLKELDARTEHLQWLESQAFKPLDSLSHKPGGEKVEKIMQDILTDAQRHLSDLRSHVETIEREIQKLDDYERCVLYHRYILGTPWLELPEKVGYEIAQCQRIERRALAQLAKSYTVQQILYKDSASATNQSVNDLAFGECAPVL